MVFEGTYVHLNTDGKWKVLWICATEHPEGLLLEARMNKTNRIPIMNLDITLGLAVVRSNGRVEIYHKEAHKTERETLKQKFKKRFWKIMVVPSETQKLVADLNAAIAEFRKLHSDIVAVASSHRHKAKTASKHDQHLGAALMNTVHVRSKSSLQLFFLLSDTEPLLFDEETDHRLRLLVMSGSPIILHVTSDGIRWQVIPPTKMFR